MEINWIKYNNPKPSRNYFISVSILAPPIKENSITSHHTNLYANKKTSWGLKNQTRQKNRRGEKSGCGNQAACQRNGPTKSWWKEKSIQSADILWERIASGNLWSLSEVGSDEPDQHSSSCGRVWKSPSLKSLHFVSPLSMSLFLYATLSWICLWTVCLFAK